MSQMDDATSDTQRGRLRVGPLTLDWVIATDCLGTERNVSLRDGRKDGPVVIGGLTRLEAEKIIDEAIVEQYRRAKRVRRGLDPALNTTVIQKDVDRIVAAGLRRLAASVD